MDSFHPTLSAGDCHSEAFGGTGCVNCRTEASLLGTLLGANCLNVCRLSLGEAFSCVLLWCLAKSGRL